MNTIWIFIPPVILIGSIIALMVFLSKKSKAIKEKKIAEELRFAGDSTNKPHGGSYLFKIGHAVLRLSEKSLLAAKILIRKSEQSIAKTISNIRARRAGKKPIREFYESNVEFQEMDILQKKEASAERDEKNQTKNKAIEKIYQFEDVRQISSEAIAKPKDSSVFTKKIAEDKLTQEDKAKEEALIYRVAENPRDIEAYRELGDYYLAVGNIRDAKDSFKMVLKLRPRDLKAKSSLREIEMKMRLGS